MTQLRKVLPFSTPTTTLRYLNASRLPSSVQEQLSNVMRRFDALMLKDPIHAAEVLRLADQVLQIYER